MRLRYRVVVLGRIVTHGSSSAYSFLIQAAVVVERTDPTDFFGNRSEMVAIDGKGDGHAEQARSPAKRPEKEFPEVEPFLANDSQEQHRFEKRSDISGLEPKRSLRLWSVHLEKPDYPLVILAGGINGREDGAVAIDQRLGFHARYEVERYGGIVARRVTKQPAFLEQALVEPGAAQGGKHSDHRSDNAAFLDE